MFHPQFKQSFIYRFISAFLVISFGLTSLLPPPNALAQALPQTFLNLPAPGKMLTTTPAFMPPLIKGITPNPANPLEFDFIIDTGDEEIEGEALRDEAGKLIKYFLASLTVPENEMWVNLSPYEKERIIPESFGVTEMGRDLLSQDYLLKQLTASLVYPEKELGKKFWKRVWKKVYEQFGTTNITVPTLTSFGRDPDRALASVGVNTFNKVWIVPDVAVVFEHQGGAFVVESHLKVMMEEDYMALQHATKDEGRGATDETNTSIVHHPSSLVANDILREVILPEIEREVNEGKGFANLRQIYHSMILAVWFKKRLKESLVGQVYVDQNKTRGIDVEDKNVKEKIYQQYLEAFRKGVYDYIKEDYDPATQEIIPRKYFSGGMEAVKAVEIRSDYALLSTTQRENFARARRLQSVRTTLADIGSGADQNYLERVRTNGIRSSQDEAMVGKLPDLPRAQEKVTVVLYAGGIEQQWARWKNKKKAAPRTERTQQRRLLIKDLKDGSGIAFELLHETSAGEFKPFRRTVLKGPRPFIVTARHILNPSKKRGYGKTVSEADEVYVPGWVLQALLKNDWPQHNGHVVINRTDHSSLASGQSAPVKMTVIRDEADLPTDAAMLGDNGPVNRIAHLQSASDQSAEREMAELNKFRRTILNDLRRRIEAAINASGVRAAYRAVEDMEDMHIDEAQRFQDLVDSFEAVSLATQGEHEAITDVLESLEEIKPSMDIALTLEDEFRNALDAVNASLQRKIFQRVITQSALPIIGILYNPDAMGAEEFLESFAPAWMTDPDKELLQAAMRFGEEFYRDGEGRLFIMVPYDIDLTDSAMLVGEDSAPSENPLKNIRLFPGDAQTETDPDQLMLRLVETLDETTNPDRLRLVVPVPADPDQLKQLLKYGLAERPEDKTRAIQELLKLYTTLRIAFATFSPREIILTLEPGTTFLGETTDKIHLLAPNGGLDSLLSARAQQLLLAPGRIADKKELARKFDGGDITSIHDTLNHALSQLTFLGRIPLTINTDEQRQTLLSALTSNAEEIRHYRALLITEEELVQERERQARATSADHRPLTVAAAQQADMKPKENNKKRRIPTHISAILKRLQEKNSDIENILASEAFKWSLLQLSEEEKDLLEFSYIALEAQHPKTFEILKKYRGDHSTKAGIWFAFIFPQQMTADEYLTINRFVNDIRHERPMSTFEMAALDRRYRELMQGVNEQHKRAYKRALDYAKKAVGKPKKDLFYYFINLLMNTLAASASLRFEQLRDELAIPLSEEFAQTEDLDNYKIGLTLYVAQRRIIHKQWQGFPMGVSINPEVTPASVSFDLRYPNLNMKKVVEYIEQLPVRTLQELAQDWHGPRQALFATTHQGLKLFYMAETEEFILKEGLIISIGPWYYKLAPEDIILIDSDGKPLAAFKNPVLRAFIISKFRNMLRTVAQEIRQDDDADKLTLLQPIRINIVYEDSRLGITYGQNNGTIHVDRSNGKIAYPNTSAPAEDILNQLMRDDTYATLQVATRLAEYYLSGKHTPLLLDFPTIEEVLASDLAMLGVPFTAMPLNLAGLDSALLLKVGIAIVGLGIANHFWWRYLNATAARFEKQKAVSILGSSDEVVIEEELGRFGFKPDQLLAILYHPHRSEETTEFAYGRFISRSVGTGQFTVEIGDQEKTFYLGTNMFGDEIVAAAVIKEDALLSVPQGQDSLRQPVISTAKSLISPLRTHHANLVTELVKIPNSGSFDKKDTLRILARGQFLFEETRRLLQLLEAQQKTPDDPADHERAKIYSPIRVAKNLAGMSHFTNERIAENITDNLDGNWQDIIDVLGEAEESINFLYQNIIIASLVKYIRDHFRSKKKLDDHDLAVLEEYAGFKMDRDPGFLIMAALKTLGYEQTYWRGQWVLKETAPDSAMLGAPTIKILVADTPANQAMLDEMKEVAASFGNNVRILETVGIGDNVERLKEVITQERPQIVTIREKTKAFKDGDFMKFARENGVLVILRAGVGMDHVDSITAAREGISVIRSHGNANSVANFALRNLLTAVELSDVSSIPDVNEDPAFREIFDIPLEEYTRAHDQVGKEGRGETLADQYSTIFRPISTSQATEILSQIKGKKIGIIGFGTIAQLTAKKLSKLRELTSVPFDILATSPSLDAGIESRTKIADQLNVRHPGKDNLLEQADILLLLLDGAQKDYLDRNTLRKTRAQTILNLARYHVTETAALQEFLERGGYYYVDTIITPEIAALRDQYPSTFVVTPHMSASTASARRQVELYTLASLQSILEEMLHKEPTTSFELNHVNPVAIQLLIHAESGQPHSIQEPKTPPGVLRYLRSTMKSYAWYREEAQQLGLLSPQIGQIFDNEINFRKTILEGIENGDPQWAPIDEFFVEKVVKHHPQSINLTWQFFNGVWGELLERKPELRKQHELNPFDFVHQLLAVINDPASREKFRMIIMPPVPSTEPNRYSVQDRIVERLLDTMEVEKPIMLDLGVSTGITSQQLQERVGGHMIAVDVLEEPFAPVTPFMLGQGFTRHPHVVASDDLEFRRDDFTKTFYEDLIGRLSVIRHLAFLTDFSAADHQKLIGDVFRYADGNPKGLIYHQTIGGTSSPRLLSQFIFHITGPSPKDWELKHAGYLFHLAKMRSLRFSEDEIYEKEEAVSRKILEIRNALIKYAAAIAEPPEDVFDEYGRVQPALRKKLIANLFGDQDQTKEMDILRHMVEDILLISPWTREYHSKYYEDQGVYAPHELAWNFVDEKIDINELLNKLLEHVPDPAMLGDGGRLIDFLTDSRADHRGRTLSMIWNYSLEEMGKKHNFIQYMFPTDTIDMWVALDEFRGRNANTVVVPIINSPEEIKIMRSNTIIGKWVRANMLVSLDRMLAFYGFRFAIHEGELTIEQADNFNERAEVWLYPYNDNFLRITRILLSLRKVGLRKYSLLFFKALQPIYEQNRKTIGDSMNYWQDAVRGLKPDQTVSAKQFAKDLWFMKSALRTIDINNDEAMLGLIELTALWGAAVPFTATQLNPDMLQAALISPETMMLVGSLGVIAAWAIPAIKELHEKRKLLDNAWETLADPDANHQERSEALNTVRRLKSKNAADNLRGLESATQEKDIYIALILWKIFKGVPKRVIDRSELIGRTRIYLLSHLPPNGRQFLTEDDILEAANLLNDPEVETLRPKLVTGENFGDPITTELIELDIGPTSVGYIALNPVKRETITLLLDKYRTGSLKKDEKSLLEDWVVQKIREKIPKSFWVHDGQLRGDDNDWLTSQQNYLQHESFVTEEHIRHALAYLIRDGDFQTVIYNDLYFSDEPLPSGKQTGNWIPVLKIKALHTKPEFFKQDVPPEIPEISDPAMLTEVDPLDALFSRTLDPNTSLSASEKLRDIYSWLSSKGIDADVPMSFFEEETELAADMGRYLQYGFVDMLLRTRKFVIEHIAGSEISMSRLTKIIDELVLEYESGFNRALPSIETTDGLKQMAAFAMDISNVKKGIFVTDEKLRFLLERNPPYELMKYHGVRDLEELLKIMGVRETFSMARYVEADGWTQTNIQNISRLRDVDFEERDIDIMIFNNLPDKAVQFFKKKLPFSDDKIAGTLTGYADPADKDNRVPYLRALTRALHYLFELHFYTKIIEDRIHDRVEDGRSIGETVSDALSDNIDINQFFEPHALSEVLFMELAVKSLMENTKVPYPEALQGLPFALILQDGNGVHLTSIVDRITALSKGADSDLHAARYLRLAILENYFGNIDTLQQVLHLLYLSPEIFYEIIWRRFNPHQLKPIDVEQRTADYGRKVTEYAAVISDRAIPGEDDDTRPTGEVSPKSKILADDEAMLADLISKIARNQNLSGEEFETLKTLTLLDGKQRDVFGITPNNVESKLHQRIKLFQETLPRFRKLMKELEVDDLGPEMFWSVYIPMSIWLYERKLELRPNEGYVVGFSGGLGVGKTTRTKIFKMILEELLRNRGEQVVIISIDDLYLTKKERLAKGFQRRGPPGTHDVQLGVEVLQKLRYTDEHSEVEIPVFDKRVDDRIEPRIVKGKVGIILFEGWIVGASTDYDPKDVEPGYKQDIAKAFKSYQPLNDELDDLVVRLLRDLDAIKAMYREQVARQRERIEREGQKWEGLQNHEINPFVESFYITPWDWVHTSPEPLFKDTSIQVDTDDRRHIVAMRLGGRVKSKPLDAERKANGLLSNQGALITGGGKNIGRFITEALARSGANVIISGREQSPLSSTAFHLKSLGYDASFLQSDISNPFDVESLIRAMVEKNVKILVNNAGVAGNVSSAPDKPLATIAEIPFETNEGEPTKYGWLDTLAINFVGNWLLLKRAVEEWTERNQKGTIVNISSHYAKQPYFLRSIYTVTKALQQAMTKALYRELKEKNISIMDIAFSLVESERMQQVVPGMKKGAQARGADIDSFEFKAILNDLIPSDPPTMDMVASQVLSAVLEPELFSGKVHTVSRWSGSPESDRKPLEMVDTLNRPTSPNSTGKHIIITGQLGESIDGLQSIVKQLLETGAKVTLLAPSGLEIPNAIRDQVKIISLESLNNETMIRNAFTEAEEKSGKPDSVIYLTGQPKTPLLDFTNVEELTNQFLNPYINASVLFTRETLKAMKHTDNTHREGSFILVGPKLLNSHPEKLKREDTTAFIMQEALQQLIRVMMVEHRVILNSPNFRGYYIAGDWADSQSQNLAWWLAYLSSDASLKIPQSRFLITFEQQIGGQEGTNDLAMFAGDFVETPENIADYKFRKFYEILTNGRIPVEIYDSTIALIKKLRQEGLGVGLASSSKSVDDVLLATHLQDLFGPKVDGKVVDALGLKGKPNGDVYLKAAELVGINPRKSVVVEDSPVGVVAGKDGHFGLVLGVNRKGDADELKTAGADIVIGDLQEITLDEIKKALKAKNGEELEGIIFDFDGVVVETIQIHFEAYRETFREYLRFRERKYGEPYSGDLTWEEFIKIYGRPQNISVQKFLDLRGIKIPDDEAMGTDPAMLGEEQAPDTRRQTQDDRDEAMATEDEEGLKSLIRQLASGNNVDPIGVRRPAPAGPVIDIASAMKYDFASDGADNKLNRWNLRFENYEIKSINLTDGVYYAEFRSLGNALGAPHIRHGLINSRQLDQIIRTLNKISPLNFIEFEGLFRYYSGFLAPLEVNESEDAVSFSLRWSGRSLDGYKIDASELKEHREVGLTLTTPSGEKSVFMKTSDFLNWVIALQHLSAEGRVEEFKGLFDREDNGGMMGFDYDYKLLDFVKRPPPASTPIKQPRTLEQLYDIIAGAEAGAALSSYTLRTYDPHKSITITVLAYFSDDIFVIEYSRPEESGHPAIKRRGLLRKYDLDQMIFDKYDSIKTYMDSYDAERLPREMFYVEKTAEKLEKNASSQYEITLGSFHYYHNTNKIEASFDPAIPDDVSVEIYDLEKGVRVKKSGTMGFFDFFEIIKTVYFGSYGNSFLMGALSDMLLLNDSASMIADKDYGARKTLVAIRYIRSWLNSDVFKASVYKPKMLPSAVDLTVQNIIRFDRSLDDEIQEIVAALFGEMGAALGLKIEISKRENGTYIHIRRKHVLGKIKANVTESIDDFTKGIRQSMGTWLKDFESQLWIVHAREDGFEVMDRQSGRKPDPAMLGEEETPDARHHMNAMRRC